MLTVILATRDRAGLLMRMLDALARVRPPPGGWRLVAVDNGSQDSTAALLRSRADALPITYVACDRPGMGAALNTALPWVRGDLVVKSDDDLLPEPGWLDAYRAAADGHPGTTLFGGTTDAEWPGRLPGWLWTDRRALAVLYALTEPADEPCEPCAVYGPHWGIRASVFARGLRFDESVGPNAGRDVYAMGCETELFGRLAAAGLLARHAPRARARHIVRSEQLTEPWILRRAFNCGLGAARAGNDGRQPVRRLVYNAAARALRPLPPSRLRTRVLFTDRLLAGMEAAGRAKAS